MTAKRIIATLRRMDEVELLDEVRQGVVLRAANRLTEVQCFLFAHLSSSLFKSGWFEDCVSRCESLEQVHQMCERFVGPWDARARVHTMLVDLLARVSARDSDEADVLRRLHDITGRVAASDSTTPAFSGEDALRADRVAKRRTHIGIDAA